MVARPFGDPMTDPDLIRIETDFAVLERDSTGFVHVTAHVIDHSIEQAQVIGEFIHVAYVESGRRTRVLADVRAARSLSRDARIYYQSAERVVDSIGCALLIDSGVSRVIGNFLIGLNKGPMTIRLFTSEQDARAWLDSLSDD